MRRNWYALVLVSGKRLSLGISLVRSTVHKIYGEDDEADDLEMTVPQLTRDVKAIQLLKSSKAVKNLGLFF